MATFHTLTVDLGSLGLPEINTVGLKAWVEANAPAIMDTDGNVVHLGTVPIALDASGVGTVDLIASNSSGVNPADVQYRVHVRYFKYGEHGRLAAWDSGWFDLLGSVNLADVAAVPPVEPTYADGLDANMAALIASTGSQARVALDGATASPVTLDAGQLDALHDSPTSSVGLASDGTKTVRVWNLSPSTFQVVGASFAPPASWDAFNVDLIWATDGSVGYVAWTMYVTQVQDGETLDPAFAYGYASTQPAASHLPYVIRRNRMNDSIIPVESGADIVTVRIGRNGADAADTCASVGSVIAVIVTRA